MPHLGGRQSTLSSALGNVMRQLKSGKTRGSNPRDLEPEEISALEQKRDALRAEMRQKAQERAVAKINGNTTAEADRVIQALHDTAAPAKAYFDAIGGAGSSVDLRLQGKALIERAREQERQEKRRATEERGRAKKAARKDAAGILPQAALIAAPDLDHCFRKSFVPAELSERIWNYILHDTSPYHVNLRTGPVKTRPKVNFSIARREGAYKIFSCYRWGQYEEDWTLIEEPLAYILELAQLAEREFGLEAGHLNNMMLTFYFNGKDQHLPNHQDKAVDFKSEGKIENTSKIFNFSFGAPRAFVVTGLDSLGTAKREEMRTVHGEFIMSNGDLFVLEPETNASCAHGVPYDESADNLRVSLVLRHVSKHEVRVLADDAAAPWEVRTRKTSGTWSKWESVKAPKQGEPTDQEDRLRHRRGQAARIFQRQELNAKETKLLREELRKLGLVTQGKRNELIERLLDSPCSTEQAL